MTRLKNKRVKILEEHETNDIFGMPIFTNEEIDFWFDFDEEELTLINSRKKLESRLDIMVQLVYFKIRKQFFEYDINAQDIRYVTKKFFNETNEIHKIGKTQIFENRKLILSYFHFTQFDSKVHISLLLSYAKNLIKKSQDPKFLLDECLNYLNQNNITIPGYTTLQESVISVSIIDEHKRIFTILDQTLKDAQKKNFLDLLTKTDKTYSISILKKDAKNFKYTAVKEECDKFLKIKSLFETGQVVLNKLDL